MAKKNRWVKGNRADVVAALNKTLKHLPKLSAKNFADALGTEFEFKAGPVAGIGPHGCPLVWKPEGIAGGGCHLILKPQGIGGSHCAPTMPGSARQEFVIHLRSLKK